MTHNNFLTRPIDYKAIRAMPPETVAEHAVEGLKRGQLNTATLWFFRCWAMVDKSPVAYLQYLICRRQLGYPLTPMRRRQVERFLKQPAWWLFIKGIRRHQLRQLHNLVNEARCGNQVRGPQAAMVKRWLTQQDVWNQHLQQSLQSAQRIHIVGNSPVLKGKNQGRDIDSADLVIRFNHFTSIHTRHQDIGQKLNIWVTAPAYNGPRPAQPDFVITTGANMLYWQQRFDHLAEYDQKQTPVLDIPLAVWRRLVRQLAAPPSAGILTIAYLLELQKEHAYTFAVKAFGFGYQPQKSTSYHLAKPNHPAVQRHNWQAEYEWLSANLELS